MSLNYNKVVYGGKVLMDLTADTISADKLLTGFTAHDASGAPITGECTFDSDTSDATAMVADLRKGKTAYVRGAKVEGSMPEWKDMKLSGTDINITGFDTGGTLGYIIIDDMHTVSGREESLSVLPVGYCDGVGLVLSYDLNRKLQPENIKSGVQLGPNLVGTYTGEEIKAQVKEVTPMIDGFSVLPDDGMDYLSEVKVAAIPYSESENAAGGLTVTIGVGGEVQDSTTYFDITDYNLNASENAIKVENNKIIFAPSATDSDRVYIKAHQLDPDKSYKLGFDINIDAVAEDFDSTTNTALNVIVYESGNYMNSLSMKAITINEILSNSIPEMSFSGKTDIDIEFGVTHQMEGKELTISKMIIA